MSEKVLVNKQPMETLPESGWVFIESYVKKNGTFELVIIEECLEFSIIDRKHLRYRGWSRTATFEKGTS